MIPFRGTTKFRKMKIEDLQIGDYLQYTADDGKDYVVMVLQLAKDGYHKEGVIFIPPWDKDAAWDVSLSQVRPIPLTEEILKKNGFRFDGSGQSSMMLMTPWEEQGIRWNIYVGLKHRTIDVHAAHPEERSPGWRKSNKVVLTVCGCYVHELQHALRLCGINKEIKL